MRTAMLKPIIFSTCLSACVATVHRIKSNGKVGPEAKKTGFEINTRMAQAQADAHAAATLETLTAAPASDNKKISDNTKMTMKERFSQEKSSAMAKSEQTIPTGNSRAAAEPFKAKAGKVPPAALIQKKSRDSEEYASSNLDEFTSRLPNGELEMRSMPGFIPNKDHAHLVDPDDPLPASVLNVDDAPKTTHSRAEDPKHQSINLAESLPMTISVKDPIHLPDQGSYFSSLMQCFPGLMMGGGGGLGMVAVVSAIAACCVYVSRKIWKWWKTFDFRESCPYIGRFMLKQGWDSFESFPVVIKIYSISEHREPCRLRIRFRSKVYETKVSTADGKWGSTTRMIVPQGCDRGEIEAVLGHREGRGKVEG